MKPIPTPETLPYWNAAKQGRLEIQQCDDCGKFFFYPGVFCRHCLSDRVHWRQVSGKAKLVSYIINHRPIAGHEGVSPIIALVELAEGPRMMSNIIGVEAKPENLALDMSLMVDFLQRDGVSLPVFQPEVAGK